MPTLLTGLMLFAVGVYVLAARPAWLVTPNPAVEWVELREASLRLTLVREAHRVRQFQAAARRFGTWKPVILTMGALVGTGMAATGWTYLSPGTRMAQTETQIALPPESRQ